MIVIRMIQQIAGTFIREFPWMKGAQQTTQQGHNALAVDLVNHLLELLFQRLSESGDELLLNYLTKDQDASLDSGIFNTPDVGDPSIGFASFVDSAYSVCLLESAFFSTQTSEQRDEICHNIASIFLRCLAKILSPLDRTALLSELPHDIKLHFEV